MAVLKTDTSDVRRLERQIETARVQLGGEAQTTARVLAQGSVFVFRSYAPRRSGRLRRGIRMLSQGGAYIVRADATNPDTGFDYVGVTRRGHRLRIIRPVHAKALRIVLPGGGVIYRTHARGYRPSGDWAQRAQVQVRRLAQGSLVRLSQQIERLLR